MKYRQTAEQLLSYIELNRRVGNTTLTIEGARHYDRPFYVLGWNIEHAQEKIALMSNSNAKPLSINKLDDSNGFHLPILIDVDIMGWMLGTLLGEFSKLELEMDRLKIQSDQDAKKYATIANELMTKVETQQDTLIKRGELLIEIKSMNWFQRVFRAPQLIRELFLLEIKHNKI